MSKEDSNNPVHPYFYCKDCKEDINSKNQDQHQGHNVVEVKQGDVDPSLGEEFRKKGLQTENKKEKDERSAAKKVLDFAMSKIKKLVISENDSDGVYAIIESNGHMESINLESKRARQWINDQYSRNVESNDVHGDDFFKNVLDSIIAKAQMNGTERARIHNRIAQLDNQIFYDLGTPDWKIIKITQESIDIVNFDGTMPLFRRTQSLQPQVMPEKGDEKVLEKFARLLHILEDEVHVFIIHLVCMFLDSGSIPMMVFDGSAGSLKTTATATVKRIVDPSGKRTDDNVSAMAEKQDDLIIQLNNRYMSSFDNVSFINNETANVLSRTITGSSNMRRKKYSDDQEVILNFRRKIVLNGIVPSLDYLDLQTRVLSYARKPIDENNRITEDEFNEKLEQLLPGLLSKIFLTLQESLKIHSSIKDEIKPKTRMADFERWGEVISRILGYQKNSFLDSYNRKMIEGQISQIDSHPIVSSIQTFMENKEHYENTISHLHQELEGIAISSGIDLNSKYSRFPKISNRLKKELKIVDPLLKAIGFTVETYHYFKSDNRFTKNASIVKIIRKKVQSTLDLSERCSLSSLSSPMTDLGTKSGEDRGEGKGSDNIPSSPTTVEFTHKNNTGEGGEDSEGQPETSSRKQFRCKTHNVGPWNVNDRGSRGEKIIDFHKDQGCEIEFIEERKDVTF